MSHENKLYRDLLTLLHNMLNHYHDLLELTQRERAVLTAASLPTLLDITTQKETLVLELSVMEEGCRLILRRLAEQLGGTSSELTLTDLSELAPEPFGDEFQCCRSDLLDLIHAVSQINAQNTLLLNFSRDATHASLRLISRMLEPAPIYGNGGNIDLADTGGKLLHRRA